MGMLSHQLGVGDEVTWNTPVTVNKFFEFYEEGIEEAYNRIEGDPLGPHIYKRSDRFQPYFNEAEGEVVFPVMSKGFDFWLEHLIGGTPVLTTGVWNATGGALAGKGVTLQVNRPFNPSGTNQPFTYSGGKVTEWVLKNEVDDGDDGILTVEADMNFAGVSTATALATATYPTPMNPFTWAGGAITLGGATFCVNELEISVDNGLDTDRRCIGSTAKSEPSEGRREIEVEVSGYFESLAQRTLFSSLTAAGTMAAFVATWTAVDGATFTVEIPKLRIDEWTANVEDADPIDQELTGMGLFDGTNPAIELTYTPAV